MSNLLDSFTFSILACLLTGYCGLFVVMHLFASSGHNDENDVSDDVEDDGINKGGNKNYVDIYIMMSVCLSEKSSLPPVSLL